MDGNAPWRLSVQQVTSCTANGFGCGGGDTIEAYEQVRRSGRRREGEKGRKGEVHAYMRVLGGESE